MLITVPAQQTWRHALVTVFTCLGMALALSGCGPVAAEAYVVREHGQYVLRPVPCNTSAFVSVTVKDPSSGEYYDQMSTLWEAKSSTGEGAQEIVLFTANKGYEEVAGSTTSSMDSAPILVAFEMPGYDTAGGLLGNLAALRDGEALTSDGVVPMEHVENWSCG